MNDKTKSVGIVLGVITAIVLSLVAIGRPTPEKEKIVERVVEKAPLGAISSPDLPWSYFSVGGNRIFALSNSSLTQASTTICAIQSPAATSTLMTDMTGIQITTSSTTASKITIAKATTAFATTTLIGDQFNIGADATANIQASTTALQYVAAAHVFAPNTWLVFGMQGGNGTHSPAGTCRAAWSAF